MSSYRVALLASLGSRERDTGALGCLGDVDMGWRRGQSGGEVERPPAISRVHDLQGAYRDSARIQKVAESRKEELHVTPACGLGLGGVAWQSRVPSPHSLPLGRPQGQVWFRVPERRVHADGTAASRITYKLLAKKYADALYWIEKCSHTIKSRIVNGFHFTLYL